MTMRLATYRALLLPTLAVLAMAMASPSQETAPAEEPRYDPSTTIDVMVVVADVKAVPGGPLGGAHLLVRLESARANSETTDIYLGPDEYLNDMGCRFNKGDRIQVKGSRTKFNGNPVVLAKEVRMGSTTLYLRDEHGVPYWKKS